MRDHLRGGCAGAGARPRASRARPRSRPTGPSSDSRRSCASADRPVVAAVERVELVPRARHRDAEAGPRARRPGARGGRAAAVAQVVDEDAADAVLRRRSWRRSAPARARQVLRRSRCEKSLTASQPSRGASGTTTCRPLPPLVLRKARRPSSSSSARISCAASWICAPGARLRRGRGRRSCGRASRSRRDVAFQVWNSTTFICAADDQRGEACRPRSAAGGPGRAPRASSRMPGDPQRAGVLLEEELARRCPPARAPARPAGPPGAAASAGAACR